MVRGRREELFSCNLAGQGLLPGLVPLLPGGCSESLPPPPNPPSLSPFLLQAALQIFFSPKEQDGRPDESQVWSHPPATWQLRGPGQAKSSLGVSVSPPTVRKRTISPFSLVPWACGSQLHSRCSGNVCQVNILSLKGQSADYSSHAPNLTLL